MLQDTYLRNPRFTLNRELEIGDFYWYCCVVEGYG